MADKFHQQYVLMHKNIPVADLELDTATGSISAVGSVCEEAHVPVGIPLKNRTIDREALNEWWKGPGNSGKPRWNTSSTDRAECFYNITAFG